MVGFTRRALIRAVAGAGLSVVGIGGLLALRGAGGTTLTATAELVGGTGIATSASAPPAVTTSTQVPAATATSSLAASAPPSVVSGTPPASAAPSTRATPPPDTLGLPSGGKYTTFVPVGKRGGSVVEVSFADAVTNSPMLSNDTSSSQRIQVQYEGLIDLNPDTALPFARLATEVPTRQNGGISWGIDPDQSMMWATDAYASGFNMGKYLNARVDDLLKQGLTELDTDKRKAIYLELQKIIMDEVPSLILDFPQSTVLASKRIRNLFPNAVNTRWNTHLWWAEDGR
jgi:ABC-type transport system substrate-binding protein